MFFQREICNLDFDASRAIWRAHEHFNGRKANIPLGLEDGLISKGSSGMDNTHNIGRRHK